MIFGHRESVTSFGLIPKKAETAETQAYEKPTATIFRQSPGKWLNKRPKLLGSNFRGEQCRLVGAHAALLKVQYCTKQCEFGYWSIWLG